MAKSRVVVVGGGFAGLACARRLAGGPVDVLLIDRHDYHQFTPLLYQVATALLTEADIAYPFRAVFRDAANVRFLQAAVTGVELERRVVRAQGGEEIPYDRLVLATGSEDSHFGNVSLETNTLSMKSLPGAQRLRNHVLACLEFATRTDDEAERRRWLTFVVVGGGPTGVEFTGALVELLALVLGREYPELPAGLARVVLVEGADQVLPAFGERLGAYARRVLERRGVEVMTGALVAKATEADVRLSDGREIASRTIVWSAGVRASELAGATELATGRSRRLPTDERLRLAGSSDVYAIGDLASIRVDGAELPMLSPPAMQAGRYVARAILAEARGEPSPEPFRYRDKGTMAVIGRNAAVASLWRLRLTGLPAWLAWLTVHLYYLIGFRNRAVVMLSWGWNYLRRDRPIRMISQTERDQLVDELAGRGTT
ncbi:MAG: NAD(P)/FAD-dependent oxidoreductase [Solirubrobacteraceae bacterium]